jgi:4-amino-4-deoxy-L-arabinose transferase-like glycosyltransferase
MPVHYRVPLALAVLLWLALVVVGLATRPLMPVDETRYLAVAWDMWSSSHYLVPHLNGIEYHHKPPLLFWLINLGWAVVGVSETWGRLVAPLFGLGCVLLTTTLARLLFPERPLVAALAPLIVIGAAFFALFTTLTFFDAMVAFFTLLGLIGVWQAAHGKERQGWTLYALALGLGILSKGPVQLLDLAPAALLAPLWITTRPASWRRWYAGFGLAVLGGAAIGLAWAIPAALAGSREFAYMLFVGQSTKRVVEAAWHEQPFWWYVPLSFGLLFPWLWWPAAWRSLFAREIWRSPGIRFCLATIVPVFAAFSAISGKQPHYLLPLIPVFALLLAGLLAHAIQHQRFDDARWMRLPPALLLAAVGLVLIVFALFGGPIEARWPRLSDLLPLPFSAVVMGAAVVALAVWLIVDRPRDVVFRTATLASAIVVLFVAVHLSLQPWLAARFDVARVAAELKAIEKTGRPVAQTFDYHGQYHFAGRLTRPITALTKDDVLAWAKQNPEGMVVDYRRDDPVNYPAQPPFIHAYRGRYVIIWPVAEVNTHGRKLFGD